MDYDKIIEHYNKMLITSSTDYGKVGWGSKESQLKRFEVLVCLGDFTGKSILDVGCGLGDLLVFLGKHGINCDYYGIDINPKVVAEARSRHGFDLFSVASVMDIATNGEVFDYIVASGSLNIVPDGRKLFVQEMVKAMFGICKVGLGVNFLSEKAKRIYKGENHINPGELLNYCLNLTSRVAVHHDYLPHDVTFFLYKES